MMTPTWQRPPQNIHTHTPYFHSLPNFLRPEESEGHKFHLYLVIPEICYCSRLVLVFTNAAGYLGDGSQHGRGLARSCGNYLGYRAGLHFFLRTCSGSKISQTWHFYRHLSPRSNASSEYTHKQLLPYSEGCRTSDRSVLAASTMPVFLCTKKKKKQLSNVSRQAIRSDTISPGPIKSSVSTCDKDGHLFS